MSLPQEVTRSLARRVLDGDLPDPVFAIVGLVDEVSNQTRHAVSVAGRTPGAIAASAWAQYTTLVERGQSRSVEMAAERAVRGRVTRFEDRVAPSAARATVRLNHRRKKWAQSPAARRAATTRARARAAADRFNELNTPVLADDEPRD